MNIKDKIKNFFDFKKNTKIRYFYLFQLFFVFINDGLNKNIITNNQDSILKKVLNSLFLLVLNSNFFELKLYRLYNKTNKISYIIPGLYFGVISSFLSELLLPIELNETGNCQYENDKVNKNNSKKVIQSDNAVVSKTLNRIINTFDYIIDLALLSVNIKDFKFSDIWITIIYAFSKEIMKYLVCKFFDNIFNLSCKDVSLSLTKCRFNNLSDNQKHFYLHSFLIGPITAALLVKGIQKWLNIDVEN